MWTARCLAVAVIATSAVASAQPGADASDESASDAAAIDPAPAPSDPRRAPSSERDPDDYIDPRELPPPEILPEPPYPRALVERPLLMPAGRMEARLAAGLGRQSIADMAPITYGAVSADVRSGRGFAELDIGGWAVPVHRDTQESMFEVPGIQQIYAAAKLRITDDTTVGALAEVRAPGSDLFGYSSSLLVAHKLRPSPGGALIAGIRASYVAQHEPLFNGFTTATTAVVGVVVLTAQLQLTPHTAIFATGAGGAYRYLDDGHPGRRMGFAMAYSGGFVISLNNNLDLEPFIESVGGAKDLVGFVAGLALTFH